MIPDEEYIWSTFTLRIPVKAEMQKLYDAWATREGIESWFLRLSDYKDPAGSSRKPNEQVKPNDTYHWRWHGWHDETEHSGMIMEANGRDYFQFTFGDAGIVRVNIKKEFGEMIVELVQFDIPHDRKIYYHIGCMKGWNFYLANLKSILEGGIDLRNRNVNLGEVVNS